MPPVSRRGFLRAGDVTVALVPQSRQCSTASAIPCRSLTVTAGMDPSSKLWLTSTSGVPASRDLSEHLAI